MTEKLPGLDPFQLYLVVCLAVAFQIPCQTFLPLPLLFKSPKFPYYFSPGAPSPKIFCLFVTFRRKNHSTAWIILYMSLRFIYINTCVVVVQVLNCVWLFTTPWTAAYQASLSFTISWSLFKLTSIESVMPSNHLVFCYPLLLLPSVFLSNMVFSNESALCIRFSLKYWNFSFSISPSNE